MSPAMEKARSLDQEDPLAFARSEFNIPTRAEIASTRLADPGSQSPFPRCARCARKAERGSMSNSKFPGFSSRLFRASRP